MARKLLRVVIANAIPCRQIGQAGLRFKQLLWRQAHWPAKGKKMKLFELIPFLSKNQQEIKVHCATGSKDIYAPKNAFLTGNFKNWQENQTQKNFERKFILSLIYWNKDEWLFAGIYESLSVKEVNGAPEFYIFLSTGSTDNIKPELVLSSLYEKCGLDYEPFAIQIHRFDVYANADEERRFIPLLELGEEIV